MSAEQRRHKRLDIHLPVRAQNGLGEGLDLEVMDISASGMKLRSRDFDALKRGFDVQRNLASFDILIPARMAWAQPDDGAYLMGWEFVLPVAKGERGSLPDGESGGKRRHPRLPIALSVRAQVSGGGYQAVEVVDISPSGMQLRCQKMDTIQAGMDAEANRALFSLCLSAHLAWVQEGANGVFLTGWEFVKA